MTTDPKTVIYDPDEPDEVSLPLSEFERLMDVDRFMDALEAAGVDNWDGYDIACQVYNGDISEDEI